ncbi:short chain dehydrogenase/reductase [Rhizodiscina lignyota]|uniref:Short chain dehydrogenase/reductase n=1 Tax=Rhizodiscina lignyota TaxID=1504668 RepID=A0A9P4IJ62_9PEZI|nr:short chain dehydrogenase/reductase [Rhizodiscina lignyota]
MSTIILITGANSGVGFSSTKVIASASSEYHIIMAGRSLEKVEAAKAEIEKTGIKGSISTIQFDVTDKSSIDAAVKQVESEFGHIDVLINNAGVTSRNPDLKAQIEETMAANVVGPALVSQGFQPLLFKSNRPYSIYVSSGLGSLERAIEHPIPNDQWTVYRMSKAALDMLMVQEYTALRGKGVKVFAMCPGLVRSNLRGKSATEVSAGGAAGDPDISGHTMLTIVQGERDADAGRIVHKDGTYNW